MRLIAKAVRKVFHPPGVPALLEDGAADIERLREKVEIHEAEIRCMHRLPKVWAEAEAEINTSDNREGEDG